MRTAEFKCIAGVSRETLEKLEAYVHLLQKWNKKINLVGKRSMGDVWRRHVFDSLQLYRFYEGPGASANQSPWLDLGSGAGFPGLVLAIAGIPNIHLVESDARKCSFLMEAARITDTSVVIHNQRIENLPSQGAQTISVRALAGVSKVLHLAHRHLSTNGRIILLKGQDVGVELTEATECWNMNVRRIQSASDKSGSILLLTEISRV